MVLYNDLNSIRIGYLRILYLRPYILYLMTSIGFVYSRLPIDYSTLSAYQISLYSLTRRWSLSIRLRYFVRSRTDEQHISCKFHPFVLSAGDSYFGNIVFA